MHDVMGSDEGFMLAIMQNLCHGIPFIVQSSETSLYQILEANFKKG